MKKIIFAIAILISFNCSPTQKLFVPDTLPELIYQAPLPALPPILSDRDITLELVILIDSSGQVKKAVWKVPTGYTEWDATALKQVEKWKFTPARYAGKSVDLWIRQSVKLETKEAKYYRLAEIVCHNIELADSLFALLKAGADFEEIARKHSQSESGKSSGILGEVDVRTYPVRVSEKISLLRIGEFSRPLKLGNHFVIIKRIDGGVR